MDKHQKLCRPSRQTKKPLATKLIKIGGGKHGKGGDKKRGGNSSQVKKLAKRGKTASEEDARTKEIRRSPRAQDGE